MRESSDTHTDLAKISFLYPPHKRRQKAFSGFCLSFYAIKFYEGTKRVDSPVIPLFWFYNIIWKVNNLLILMFTCRLTYKQFH